MCGRNPTQKLLVDGAQADSMTKLRKQTHRLQKQFTAGKCLKIPENAALGHSFSPYGSPSRQITYNIYF